MFELDNVSDGVEYIRTALHHAILLWTNERNYMSNLESWWRSFVYGPLFDTAFMFLGDYNIIRSESESTAYKEYSMLYKDIIPGMVKHKVEKVDLAVRTIDNRMDILTGEDKPLLASKKAVAETFLKNQERRVVTLDVIERKLPKPKLIQHFEVFTALWHGNKMTIHCTRKIDKHYFHYEAAQASFPLTASNFHEFTRLLLLVLSLKIQ
ncbi:hypothetical protein BDB00DRAFT_792086 [Zychaea mexicana]|uniref:uncharacterized protein n=1 Tax=Zychaea mexicana TaxID=64656 RepID=UPI0022FEA7E8|nr:uncharacterized protein BDB00DRAFT_792086 [Zychaea mexicana]KAI9488182.1 hypothetical protein BDB00DRAFT_792086 [Zychaea mexicana]